MSLAVYPGSFDPLTLGHVDIAARATTLFDVVVIGIAHNAAKAGRHLLDVHERLRLAREATSHLPGVEVDIVPGLLADYCTQHGANAIIKGLRNGSDLDAELPMALLNRDLGAPETVSALVPPAVAHALEVRLSQAPGSAAHDGVDSGLIPPGTPPSRFVGADHTREDLP